MKKIIIAMFFILSSSFVSAETIVKASICLEQGSFVIKMKAHRRARIPEMSNTRGRRDDRPIMCMSLTDTTFADDFPEHTWNLIEAPGNLLKGVSEEYNRPEYTSAEINFPSSNEYEAGEIVCRARENPVLYVKSVAIIPKMSSNNRINLISHACKKTNIVRFRSKAAIHGVYEIESEGRGIDYLVNRLGMNKYDF